MSRTNGSKNGIYGNNIDKKQFERLCSMLCTEDEIAGFFQCSIDTVERWCLATYKKTFEEIYSIKCALGKISLRRMQFKLAEENSSMAIWLGKQILGQKDRTEEEIESKITVVNNVPKDKII